MVNFFGRQRLPQRHLCGTAPINNVTARRSLLNICPKRANASSPQSAYFTAPQVRFNMAALPPYFTAKQKTPRRAFFWLTAFRQIRFCRISVDRHFAKVSAHILYPELRHPRLYQTEFTFIYEEFDLYRSLAIPVVWHYSTSLRISIPFISSESLWKSQTVFISSSVQPISSLISESLFSRSTVQMIALTLTEDREPFQTPMPSPSIDVVFSI